MDDNDDRRWVLVEKMTGDMEAIKEYVSLIPGIKATVDHHSEQLEAIEGRLGSVELRLGTVEEDLKEIKGYVIEHHEAIAELKVASHTH